MGVTTAFDYGNLGMIGNVLVSEDYRGPFKGVYVGYQQNNYVARGRN